MIQERTERLAAGRALVFGFLIAALIFAVVLAARPAHAATTFTANSTADYRDTNLADNRCRTGFAVIGVGELCTLRAAMEQANATPGADAINFAIPGSGVKTIKPGSELPQITDTLTIDGYSQPGASPNTNARGNNAKLLIELDGANAGNHAGGLRIAASNSVVKGLVINRFGGSGIHISGEGNEVEGNFIGTDPGGIRALGNLRGVSIEGSVFPGDNNTIGGASPDKRNLISGNRDEGVQIFGNSPSGNRIQGNFIGTDKGGTGDLGNRFGGVEIVGASNNTVGNTTSGAANTIAFNGTDGVIVNTLSRGGKTFVPEGNRILSNSIFSNGEEGIDLEAFLSNGRTPNDAGDTDTGANNLQNFPVLSSATTSSSRTTIEGRLNSTPGKTFTIRFFSNPSGNEGKTSIGQKSVTTNAKGNVSFSFSPARAVKVGRTITATATSSGGDTSEFSAPRKVAQG